MRITLFSLAMMFCSLLCAQNNQATLELIKETNSKIKNIESDFNQTKTIAANGKELISNGTLYITDDDKMAMYYNTPSTDLLIINENDFYMIRGKKKNHFNTEKNKAMKSLRNTLLYCVHGNPSILAEENNASLTVNKEKDGYVVTLTSQKKTPRGYEKIVLNYDIKTMLLTRMQMDEWNGNSTLYEMKNMKIGANIDVKLFDIPKK